MPIPTSSAPLPVKMMGWWLQSGMIYEQDQQRPEVRELLSQHPQAFFIAKPEFVHHAEGVNRGSQSLFGMNMRNVGPEGRWRPENETMSLTRREGIGGKLGDFLPL